MPPFCLLPIRSSEPSTQTYLDTKLRSYEISIENECFDDAYVNAHLIFVYWLYCKLWVVILAKKNLADQIFALHSFDSKFNRSKFLSTKSALELHSLKLEERKYAEVFGALCLDRSDVTLLKKLVDDRNSILHPSGLIVCSSQIDLDARLEKQGELAKKIAEFTAPIYISLARAGYSKKLNYRNLLNWEDDYELEQALFTKYHISPMDFSAMKDILRAKR